MFYDTRKNDHGLPHNPFKAIVAPRPIGWITSMSAKGEINLAPYSFFNGITDKPPIVMFSSEGPKDSVAFVEETKEFVCSLATFDLRDQMNGTVGAAAARRAARCRRPALKPRRRGWSSRRGLRPRPARWNANGCRPSAARRRGPAARTLRGVRPGHRRLYRRPLHQERPARHRGDAADRALRL